MSKFTKKRKVKHVIVYYAIDNINLHNIFNIPNKKSYNVFDLMEELVYKYADKTITLHSYTYI